jgi:addiction module RelB/DinJ family antitoxin
MYGDIMNTTLTIRIDAELKRRFVEVLDELGLDAPTAVRMLATQTVRTKTLPLSLSILQPEQGTLGFLESVHAKWGEW